MTNESNQPEPTIPPGDMRGWPETAPDEIWAGTDNFGHTEDRGDEVFLVARMAMSDRGVIRLIGRRGKRRVEIRLAVADMVAKGWTPPDYETFRLALEAQNKGGNASCPA